MRFVDKTSSLDVRRLFLSSLCLSFSWYSLFVFLLFFTFIYSYFFFPWFSQETIQRTLLTVAILPFSIAVWGSIYIVECISYHFTHSVGGNVKETETFTWPQFLLGCFSIEGSQIMTKSMKRQNQCKPEQLLTFDWKLFYGLFG